MVFKSAVNLSVATVVEALQEAHLENVDLETLLPSSPNLILLSKTLGWARCSNTVAKKLRKFILNNLEGITRKLLEQDAGGGKTPDPQPMQEDAGIPLSDRSVSVKHIESDFKRAEKNSKEGGTLSTTLEFSCSKRERCEEIDKNLPLPTVKHLKSDISASRQSSVYETPCDKENVKKENYISTEGTSNPHEFGASGKKTSNPQPMQDDAPVLDCSVTIRDIESDVQPPKKNSNEGGALPVASEISCSERNRREEAPTNLSLPTVNREVSVISPSLQSSANETLCDKENVKKDIPSSIQKGDALYFGSFLITANEWNKMWNWEKNKFIPRIYASLFIKLLTESLPSTCVINVFNTRINKSNIVLNCYCAHSGCRKFNCVSKYMPIRGGNMIFHVSIVGLKLHENTPKLTRYVTGLERENFKQALSTQKAFEFRQNTIMDVEPSLVKDGNLGDVKSQEALRKMRSQFFAEEDLHPHVIINAVLDWEKSFINYVPDDVDIPEKHVFIHRMGLPMHAFMHSIEELELFLTASKENAAEKKGPVLHLDATSSVVMPYTIKDVKSFKCFYYALCFSVKSKIITLSSSIMSQHDSCRIAMWLLELRAFLSSHQHWPLRNNLIVIDGSYPLLYASLLVFNTMTLVEYLNYCHRFVCNVKSNSSVGGEANEFNESISIIRACCAHKMKNFSQLLKAEAPVIARNKDTRKFLLQCLGSLIMSADYKSVKLIFQQLFILLLTPFANKAVEQATKILKKSISNSATALIADVETTLLCDFQQSIEVTESVEVATGNTLYEQSPFFQDIKVIYDTVEASSKTHDEKDIRPDDLDNPDNLENLDDPDDPADPSELLKDTEKTNAPKNGYYCRKLAFSILKRHVPTLCLWTGIMKRSSYTNDPIRFSNSIVECWMKIVKKDVLKGQTNLRLNRFYNRLRRTTLSVSKEMKLNIPPKPYAQSRKKKSVVPKVRKPAIKKTPIKKKYKKTKALTVPKKCHSKSNISCKKIEADFPPFDSEEQWSKRTCRPDQFDQTYFVENVCAGEKETDIVDEIVRNEEGTVLVIVETAEHSPLPVENVDRTLNSSSFKTEHVDDSIKLFLGNGLINDPNYYVTLQCVAAGQERVVNYFICKFTEHPFGGVFFKDFESLRPNQWLTGFLIDAVAESLIRSEAASSFLLIPSIHSSDILDGSASPLHLQYYDSSKLAGKEFIVLFYNMRRCHWCLVIVHVSTKSFFFLDPMSLYEEKDFALVRKLLRNFIFYFNSTLPGLSSKGWKVSSFKHPLQTDFVNCGVYVLFYLIIILKSSSIVSCIPDSMMCIDGSSNPFNADKLRLILQNFLLATSEAVHDSCAVCSRKERKEYSNLCCFRCKRWVHDSSNCRDYFPPDTAAADPICRLCNYYFAVSNDFSLDKSAEMDHQSYEEENGFISDVGLRFNEALKEVAQLQQDDEDADEEVEFIPDINCTGELDPGNLFFFLEYIEPTTSPNYIRYVPVKTTEQFIQHSKVPRYVARNPFPAPLSSIQNRPWCFHTLSNGLIDRLDYYIPVPTINDSFLNYPVAAFQFSNLLCGDIYYEDFASLNSGELVSHIIIDVVMNLFIKFFSHEKKNIFYLNCGLTKTLFTDSIISLTSRSKIVFPDDADYICMIRHENLHWTLILIDRRKSSLLFLDPYGGSKEIERGMEVVSRLSFLNDHFKFSSDAFLQLVTVPHVQQAATDNTNCALYCLFFTEQWLTSNVKQIGADRAVLSNFCPEEYRESMKRTILWHSDDMSQICCVCNIDDLKFDLIQDHNRDHFIVCMDCERSIHLKNGCLLSNITDLQSWEPHEYYCPLCDRHRSSFQKPQNSQDSVQKYLPKSTCNHSAFHSKEESKRKSDKTLSQKIKESKNSNQKVAANPSHDRLKIHFQKAANRERNSFWAGILP